MNYISAAVLNKATAHIASSCIGNPGPGGWGVYAVTNTGTKHTFSGYEAQTNNQRIEMTAGIRAIEELPIFDTLHIMSNSQPLIRGMNEWLPNWKTNGWKTAANNPVANRDLWERLDRLNQERLIEWSWLKKSTKKDANKKAYGLAQQAIRSS